MIALAAALALSVAPATRDTTHDSRCDGFSTYEMNQCMEGKLKRSQARLDQYVAAAVNRHTDADGKPDYVALSIRAAETAFDAYRSIECDTVYENWRDGTIRGVMGLGCRLKLTDQRTHTVWQNWLQYMDSTPPILPEPKPAN